MNTDAIWSALIQPPGWAGCLAYLVENGSQNYAVMAWFEGEFLSDTRVTLGPFATPSIARKAACAWAQEHAKAATR